MSDISRNAPSASALQGEEPFHADSAASDPDSDSASAVDGEPSGKFAAINGPEFLERLRSSGPESQAAFRKLVEATHGPLTSYMRRFLSPVEDAQEALQDVYLGVYKGLHRFEGKSKLSTWIFSLAHNKICDRLSDRYRRFESLLEDGAHEAPPEITPVELLKATPWDLRPDQVALQSAVKKLIARAVASLPAKALEVYHLRDVENLPGDEVSRILGVPESTLRVRLHRTRNLIVQMVKAMLNGEAPAAGAAREGSK